MAAVSTPAVLLRGYDYSESSRILRFYTLEHGLLSVMARGVRGRSGKGAASLTSFASGELTAWVRPQRDLHTMKDFACGRTRSGLGRDVIRFAGASCLVELVLSHAEQESQPGLFAAVEDRLDLLDRVPTESVPGAILAGLWVVTEAFGFAPQTNPCVRCGQPLGAADVGRFDFAAGGVRCPRCAEGAAGPRIGPGARSQLERLIAGEVPPDLTHVRQHLGLVADFISYHTAAKPLKSLQFLARALPPDVATEERE